MVRAVQTAHDSEIKYVIRRNNIPDCNFASDDLFVQLVKSKSNIPATL